MCVGFAPSEPSAPSEPCLCVQICAHLRPSEPCLCSPFAVRRAGYALRILQASAAQRSAARRLSAAVLFCVEWSFQVLLRRASALYFNNLENPLGGWFTGVAWCKCLFFNYLEGRINN